jgi:hypothetical protein
MYIVQLNNGKHMKSWWNRKFKKRDWEQEYKNEKRKCEEFEFKYNKLFRQLNAILEESRHG